MADPFKTLIRPLLFSGLRADPEWLHNQSIQLLAWLAAPEAGRASIRNQLQKQFACRDSRLQQQYWNLTFPNPLGLAAGFDKDGQAIAAWPAFGFGFCEVGTVTRYAQPGNPKPRLFRLVEDQAALNRMGFNNRGAAVLAQRLHHQSQTGRSVPLGINIGKSKVTPLETAAEDYVASFKQLQAWGDYFVVNVSSPNTPGLRSLQATDQLEPILAALQEANDGDKPLLVKIAPDLDWHSIRGVIDLAQKYELAGMVATNTTIRRDPLKTETLPRTGQPITQEAGGISGAPLRQRSTEVIRFIWQETQGQMPVIGVGGIFTADDAWEKLTAGACLLQVYTGWIYEGPWMVRRIMEGLLSCLEEHGLSTIQAAVGLDHINPGNRNQTSSTGVEEIS